MAELPTYEYYREKFKGTMDAEAFGAWLRYASAAVSERIWPNEPDGSDEWMNAVCAAAEVEAAYGRRNGVQGGVSSFTVGSFSATSTGRKAYDSDLASAIERELACSPLLYRGLGDR